MQNFSKIIKLLSLSFPMLSLLLGIPLMTFSCCSSSSEYLPEKMDTPLQQRISQLEKEDADAIIQFTGKTNMSINDEMKTKLKSTGITTESIIQDIFTASGNMESVKKVSMLDFVGYLELVQKLDIK